MDELYLNKPRDYEFEELIIITQRYSIYSIETNMFQLISYLYTLYSAYEKPSQSIPPSCPTDDRINVPKGYGR